MLLSGHIDGIIPVQRNSFQHFYYYSGVAVVVIAGRCPSAIR